MYILLVQIDIMCSVFRAEQKEWVLFLLKETLNVWWSVWMKELPKFYWTQLSIHTSMVSGCRGSMENANLCVAININLWGSLKRNIPGLSVLLCTSDITGHFALSPETQHSQPLEIKYALLQIFTRIRSQECLTKDIPGHFFPHSNTFNQHTNTAKFISLEKCVTSRGEREKKWR